MPSFKKRHGRWEIRFKKSSRQPKEKSESLPINTSRNEVRRIEGKMNSAYYGDDWDPWQQTWSEYQKGEVSDGFTIRHAVDKYIKFCIYNNRWNSVHTRNSSVHVLESFCEHTGPNKQTNQITNHNLASFIENYDVSVSTQVVYFRVVKAFINWLLEKGFNKNKFSYRPPKKTSSSILYIKEHEKDKLIESVHDTSVRNPQEYIDMWNMLYYQCMRAGELMPDTHDGLDHSIISGNYISILGKGNKTRMVPIVAPVRDMLLERKCKAEENNIKLFKPTSRTYFFKVTKKIIRSVLPSHRHDLNLHSFRRGGGVYWTQKGKPLAAIKELMGHSSIVTTEKHYARFQPEGLDKVFG